MPLPQILKGLKGMSTFHESQNTGFLSRLEVAKPDKRSTALAWNLRREDRDMSGSPLDEALGALLHWTL